MSFTDLKSKRQSKDSISYVSALSGPVASVPTQSLSTFVAQDDVLENSEALQIRKTDYAGRGLFAREHFKPGASILRYFTGEFVENCLPLEGSVILSVEPHVFVISNQYLDSHCSSCAKAASTVSIHAMLRLWDTTVL
ncbi:hypothetical protein JVU11DRAFT_8031 [Chiua virens]|nr:hypothetical protein JVU11DRAFT_8031 [Chiua virens]